MNDLHTQQTTTLPLHIRMIGRYLRVLEKVSFQKATQTALKLFCSPQKVKLKQKHLAFYEKGECIDVQTNSHKVKVWVQGNGPVVFICHGWNSRGYNMRHIALALVKKGYKVIMPDLPCHGRSEGIKINQIDMSYVINDLLLYFNQEQPIEYIVTHSWGGTATLLALDRIESKFTKLKKVVNLSMPVYPKAIMDLFCQTLNLSENLETSLIQELEKIASVDNRNLEEAFPLGLKSLFENKNIDFLLIHDEDDQIIPVENAYCLQEKYTHISFLKTQGLGHIDIVKNDIVNDFISQHFEG